MAVTVDELVVRIKADMSSLQRELTKIEGNVSKSTDKMQSNFRKIGATIAAIGGAALGVNLTKGIIQTGIAVDTLGLKMNTMFGSAEAGAKAFDILDKFASRVPFSLAEISAGAGPLAVVAGEAENMGELLQITGNIAALTGRPFNEMAGQIQKAMSGGITAAELLRDDGVKAMLGFKDGVTYSAAETIKRLQDGFGTGGKFDGIMDKLAKTAKGAMSMVGDAFFQMQKQMFQAGIADAVIVISGALRNLIISITPLMNQVASFMGLIAKGLAPAINFLADNIEVLTIFLGLLVAKMVLVKVASLAAAGAIAIYTAASTALAVHTATAVSALTFMQKAIVITIAGVKGLGAALLALSRILMRFLPFAVLAGVAYLVQLMVQLSRGAGGVGKAFGLLKDVVVAFIDIQLKKFEQFRLKMSNFGNAIRALFAAIMINIQNNIQDGINLIIKGVNSILATAGLPTMNKLTNLGGTFFADMRDSAQGAITATDAQIAVLDGTIEDLQETLKKTKAALKDAFEKGDMDEVEIKIGEMGKLKLALEDLEDGIDKMTPKFQMLHDAAQSLGDGVTSAFRDMLDGTKITMTNMTDLVKKVVRDLVAEFIRLTLINQMMNAMFGNVKGYQAKPVLQVFGGGSAGGGAAYGGQPMLVGERGPELFVPHSAGRIMNNASSQRAIGGGSVVVNQTINVETGVSQTVRAEMLSLLPVIKQDTMNAVADQNRRGGSFRQALA